MKILKLIKKFIDVFDYFYRSDGFIETLEYIKIIKRDNKPCSFEKLVNIMEHDLDDLIKTCMYWGC